MHRSKRILIAPLNWGLGHTTRCMPIIQWLIDHGHTPVFAGAAHQISFIQQTWPHIEGHILEGYNIQYARSAWLTKLKLAAQIGTITQSVAMEQKWLQANATTLQLDGIISDNRFGLYHKHLPSVILTHQVNVLSGWGALGDWLSQRQNKKWLSKFAQQWIVDIADEKNALAGKLSHPAALPNAHYIGWLSPFAGKEPNNSHHKRHILILLSGPEPQRTQLSDRLFDWVAKQNEPIVFIEGSNEKLRKEIPKHIQYYPRIAPKDVAPLLLSARYVVCRSGYSTLMDLLATHTPAYLIPTQGQAEQEYLARYIDRRYGFVHLKKGLSTAQLPQAISHLPAQAFELYRPIVSSWVAGL